MKKLAIIGVIIVGGGIFAGCMFESNKQVTKPVEQTLPKTSDSKVVSQVDPQKSTKNDATDVKKDVSDSSENINSSNTVNKTQDVEKNENKNIDVRDNIVDKSDIKNSIEQNSEINQPKPQDNKSSNISQNVGNNIIKNNTDASDLVRKYYQNKYPSINQSNWSTDVIENQTIDGKTGYLVRLYDYMNSHSNNIAWILVEKNGTMYSTEAGSGPLVKLN